MISGMIISFIIYLMTLKYNLNEDYGYYHLPYIINLTLKNYFWIIEPAS